MVKFDEPVGPGYQVVFDRKISSKGYSEIRVWAHVFIDNYQVQHIGPNSRLKLRFLHDFGVNNSGQCNSFDYESGTVQTWDGASFINGYVSKPVIGNEVRVICEPENLPPGPYTIWMTYYLIP